MSPCFGGAVCSYGVVRPRWTELVGTVRSSAVVVSDVAGKYCSQVPLTEDQHSVGEFGSGGEYESLGEAICPRQSGRNLHDSDARNGYSPRDVWYQAAELG